MEAKTDYTPFAVYRCSECGRLFDPMAGGEAPMCAGPAGSLGFGRQFDRASHEPVAATLLSVRPLAPGDCHKCGERIEDGNDSDDMCYACQGAPVL